MSIIFIYFLNFKFLVKLIYPQFHRKTPKLKVQSKLLGMMQKKLMKIKVIKKKQNIGV